MTAGLAPVPTDTRIASPRDGKLMPWWQNFFSSVHDFLGPIGQSGVTAKRPLDSSRNPLYVGQPYFDTTLGKPIWVKSRNPTVWVDATGAAV